MDGGPPKSFSGVDGHLRIEDRDRTVLPATFNGRSKRVRSGGRDDGGPRPGQALGDDKVDAFAGARRAEIEVGVFDAAVQVDAGLRVTSKVQSDLTGCGTSGVDAGPGLLAASSYGAKGELVADLMAIGEA